MEPHLFRPLGGLAVATSMLLGVAAATSASFAIVLYYRVAMFRDFLAHRAGPADVDNAYAIVSTALFVELATILATGIVFMIWQYRFARNAETLRGPLGLAPGWAIGGWFIPVANLVLPFLQLSYAAKASDPDLGPDDLRPAGRAPGVFKAWTATYVAVPVTYVVLTYDVRVSQANSLDSYIAEMIRSDLSMWFSMLLATVAAILGLFMVRTLTRRQEQAIANLARVSG